MRGTVETWVNSQWKYLAAPGQLSVEINSPELKIVVTHSAERTGKIAGELCEEGPLDHPYHPQHLVERIKRLRQS